MNLNPKLKWHLPAQNVFRIQQAAVQILLRTVLLLSQLTSENLKQEISYSRELLCLLHFLQSNTSKTTQIRFVAQYFQFLIHEHL